MDDYVDQKDLRFYWNDIRKVKKEMEANIVSVEEKTSRDAIARGTMGAASVIGTILILIWKVRGKIKNLQTSANQHNKPSLSA